MFIEVTAAINMTVPLLGSDSTEDGLSESINTFSSVTLCHEIYRFQVK